MNKGTKNPHNPIWNKRISESNKGRISPFLGRKHTEATKEKLRIANLGKHPSEETREKFRKRQLGKKLPKEVIAKIVASRKGYKHSKETKEKIRLGHLGKIQGKPDKEHRRKLSEAAKKYWGPRIDIEWIKLYKRIRYTLETRLWREGVFKRDGYSCVECGDSKGGNLNADHIKPFIVILRDNNIKTLQQALKCKELWDLNNGKTLCISCHQKTITWGNKAKLWQKSLIV